MKIKHSNAKPVPDSWSVIVDPSKVDSEALLDWCGEQKWALETGRGRYNTCRLFWKWVATKELLPDIASVLPFVKQTHGKARVTPYDVYFMALIQSDNRTRIILRLAGECGLRRAEIAVVHIGREVVPDPIFPGEWLLVVHGKGHKTRHVPLPLFLATEMLALGDSWLLPGNVGGHLSPAWVVRLASRSLESRLTLHTLRARFATDAWLIDPDLSALQELLRHASSETTRHYVGADGSRLRHLVEGGVERRSRLRTSISSAGSDVVNETKSPSTPREPAAVSTDLVLS